MYELRQNPQITASLGERLAVAGFGNYIFGHINSVKGDADISFKINGGKSDSVALVELQADKSARHIAEWKFRTFRVVLPSGEVVDLARSSPSGLPVE